MKSFIMSTGFVLFFIFAAYGAGCIVTSIFLKKDKPGWAYKATMGVTVWVVLGGILNLFEAVFPVALKTILLASAVFSVVYLVKKLTLKNQTDSLDRDSGVSAAPIWSHFTGMDGFFLTVLLAILCFLTYNLMPSSAYNFHDDFHSYFNSPVQLLGAGGFRENNFSQFGYHTLGAQAFLKSFILLFFDVRYFNTFDAIICFLLGTALVMEYARQTKSSWGLTITAVLIFAAVNPQIVNTSSVYSSTLMILGLILSSFYLGKNMGSENSFSLKRIVFAVLPVSLFYAVLAALKANLIIYAGLFFIIRFLGEIIFLRGKKIVLAANAAIILVSSLLLLPWLLSPSTKYFEVLSQKISAGGDGAAINIGQTEVAQQSFDKFFSFFSTADLFYGASWPDYLAIFLILIAIILINLFCLAKGRNNFPAHEAIIINAASLTPIISFMIILPMADSPETALRYNIPLLIAILPVIVLFSGRELTKESQSKLSNCGGVIVGGVLICIGMFSGSFLERIERISAQRHLISFPVTPEYLDFMRYAMGETRRSQIRDAQSFIQNDTEVLAWISTPFHLDFRRNRIKILESLGQKWVGDFPLNTDVKTLWQFFREQGIEYIIWEYAGAGVKDYNWYVRSKGFGSARKLFFIRSLPSLANHTKLLYDNNSMMVLDIRNFQ